MAVTEQVEQLAQLGRAQTVSLTDQQVVDLTRAWVDAWDDLVQRMHAGVRAPGADHLDWPRSEGGQGCLQPVLHRLPPGLALPAAVAATSITDA